MPSGAAGAQERRPAATRAARLFTPRTSPEYKRVPEVPQFEDGASACAECHTGQTKRTCSLHLVEGRPRDFRLKVTKWEGGEGSSFYESNHPQLAPAKSVRKEESCCHLWPK